MLEILEKYVISFVFKEEEIPDDPGKAADDKEKDADATVHQKPQTIRRKWRRT